MSGSSDSSIPNKCASRGSNDNSVNGPRRSIFHKIISFCKGECGKDPRAKWEDIIMRKMDLRGAYTLLLFDPRDAHLFGMELTDDLLIFFLCGIYLAGLG